MMNGLKQSIVWDWNGTLLNDARLCVEVMNGILEGRGMPRKDLDFYHAHFGFPVKDYYQLLGFDFALESFDEVGVEFIHRYQERQYESDLQPLALELLIEFQRTGMKQYILSARHSAALLENIRHYRLERFFDGVMGLGDHLAYGKEELGQSFIRSSGLNPQSLLFIGDTLHDAEVADAMGVECLLVSHGHQSKDRLLRSGKRVVDDFSGITSIGIRA